jgi:inner membrane protein
VGGIRWLAPWSDRFYRLAVVPALHHPWWLNFALHGSFLLELVIVGWAAGLAVSARGAGAGRSWFGLPDGWFRKLKPERK